MRRTSASILSACVLVGVLSAPPADARKRPRRVARTVTYPYSAPAAAITTGGEIIGACTRDGVGCVDVTPYPGELFASVEVVDDAGTDVHALVELPGGNVELCTETDETIYLNSDDPFLVWIFEGPCADGTPAAATSGDVVVTLSNQG